MCDNNFIIFPCDHKRWPDIREVLVAAKASQSAEMWISALQKAHNLVHVEECMSTAERGAKTKWRNVFSGLKVFLEMKTTLEESYNYIDNVLPQVVDLALQIERLKPVDGLQVLRQQRDGTCILSKHLAASVVSCAFLCLFPGRCPTLSQNTALNPFSFDNFFPHLESDFQCAKLRKILNYFSTASELQTTPLGNIMFSRKVLYIDKVPKSETWVHSTRPLCPVFVHRKSGDIQRDSCAQSVQVVFGNKNYGGSFLISGRSKEDLLLSEHPELISGILFVEDLTENEAMLISTGSEADSLLSPSAVIRTEESGTSICLLDRLLHERDYVDQLFQQQNINYLLTKLFSSFCLKLDGAGSQTENVKLASSDSIDSRCGRDSVTEDELTGETSETDLPASSDSLNGSSCHDPRLRHSKPPLSLGHEIGSRLYPRKTRTAKNLSSWRSNSSSDSSSSFPDFLSRAMSLEADSSGCPTPDDPLVLFARRRNSAIHSGPSSRRSSTLQGQSSFTSDIGDPPGFCGFNRRRSSGMSDFSQRSSTSSSNSGKRSSTDYSSEMDECYEGFQRSDIKTCIIEEETGAASVNDEALLVDSSSIASIDTSTNNSRPFVSKLLQKFSLEQPKDVSRPQPIKGDRQFPSFSGMSPSVVQSHKTLDHFVDNLINEVAQDSKLEIEEMVREQQLGPGPSSSSKRNRSTRDGPCSSCLVESDSLSWNSSVVDGRNCDRKFGNLKKLSEVQEKDNADQSRKSNVEYGRQLYDKTSKANVSEQHINGNEKWTMKDHKHIWCNMEEVDKFVMGFVNSVFKEAINVYCHDFDSFKGRWNAKWVEELWISPTSQRHQHSVPNFSSADTKSFQKTSSRLGSSRLEDHGSIQIFPGQTCYEEGSLWQNQNATYCTSDAGRANDVPWPIRGTATGVTSSFKNIIQDPQQQGFCQGSWPREYLLGWFDNTTSVIKEKQLASVDWFAQVLVVDVLNDALVDLIGLSALQDAFKSLYPNCKQSLGPGRALSDGAEQQSTELLRYASSLAKNIILDGSSEAARYITVSTNNRSSENRIGARLYSTDSRSFPFKCPGDLEEIASEFSRRLISEAVSIMADSRKHVPKVTVSLCGSGAYKDEPQLMALLHWVAASMASVPEVHFQTQGTTYAEQIDIVCQSIISHQVTVGSLLSEILNWCEQKRKRPNDLKSLFDFLLLRLT